MAAKLQVKLYAEDTTLDGEAYIPLFHGWIRDSAMPELLIDVADYRHVPDGPGVALIGHESDYFLDFQDGRPGLLCALKHADAEGLAAQLRLALTRAIKACALAEEGGGGAFSAREVVVRLVDRLNYPNTDATWSSVSGTLHDIVSDLLGREVTITREGEPREPLTARILVKGAAKGEPAVADMAELAKSLI